MFHVLKFETSKNLFQMEHLVLTRLQFDLGAPLFVTFLEW